MALTVLVIGAAGFIGSKLVKQLLIDGKIGDDDHGPIGAVILADVIPPEIPTVDKDTSIKKLSAIRVDITDPESVQTLLSDSPDVIFHLAAIVSGDAEANFDLGYKVNVDGTRNLLEAIRNKENYLPRLVFSSSIAVYGTPIPDVICDDQALTPRGSYGTQKAMVELFMEDYTRKGFVDGVTIRFPTIAIRPGKPNKAASSFISGIIREPLNQQPAILPISDPSTFRHPIASPRKAVEYLLKAAALKPVHLGDRLFNVPSISLTVTEMIEALKRVAGEDVAKFIQHVPDPFIEGITKSWPKEIKCERAAKLGFTPDASYDDIVRQYMKDELGVEK